MFIGKLRESRTTHTHTYTYIHMHHDTVRKPGSILIVRDVYREA